MSVTFLKLSRDQLDQKLAVWQGVKNQTVPIGGWLRAIRRSLGLSRLVLAKRLQVAPGTVDDIERSEAAGSTTLNTLRKAAAAMDCELVYAIVPKTTLNTILKDRAFEKAKAILGRVGQTMKLEDQEVDSRVIREQAEALVDALMDKPQTLWK